MHPTIADLVSESFYGGTIESMTLMADKVSPLPRVCHPFRHIPNLSGKSILWLDTGRGTLSHEESSAGRYTSASELSAITKFLLSFDTEESTDCDLAILSPYRAQVRRLRKEVYTILDSLPSWMRQKDGKSLDVNDIINSVDSFQGNEASVVVVSLVRNNSYGFDDYGNKTHYYSARKSLGFLLEEERMSVLLSRAEQLLVLVGSWDFFAAQVQGVQPSALEPLTSWKRSIDYLAKCFENETAIRLSVAQIGSDG